MKTNHKFKVGDKVYDLKQYESGSTNKRLLMELPNYIYEQLK